MARQLLLQPSPVVRTEVFGLSVLLKRDDWLVPSLTVQDDSKGTVSGNKARKLYHVLHALQHGLLPPSIQRLV